MSNVRKVLRWITLLISRNAFRSSLLAGVLAAICMISIFAVTLVREKDEILRHAEQQATNLITIAERDIARNFEIYSLSLQSIADSWQRSELMALPMDARRAALFDGSLTARYISSAIIVDRDGKLLLNLKRVVPVVTDFSDRDYFQKHRANVGSGVSVSGPFLSRRDGVTYNIALSRRLSGSTGEFEGVAVLFLDVKYFRDLLEGLDIGERGRTRIYGPDGTLYMNIPYSAEIGTDRSASATYQRMTEQENGIFVAQSVFDDQERIFVFRTVPGDNVKVLIALSTQDVYAPWRQRALPIVASVGIYAGVLILLSGLFGRELQARTRAERTMKLLSNTDGLTGLPNRRALDRILADESKVADEKNTSLGVLFADIDYFKRYNDLMGHLAGDAVLESVAKELERSTQRSGDKTGRYGGEEFLTVMAQTDAEGGRVVAEKMRAAVEALGIPHPASPLGVITLSIGVAALSQDSSTSVRDLVNAADEALYAAKKAGRNRVRVYPPPEIASGDLHN